MDDLVAGGSQRVHFSSEAANCNSEHARAERAEQRKLSPTNGHTVSGIHYHDVACAVVRGVDDLLPRGAERQRLFERPRIRDSVQAVEDGATCPRIDDAVLRQRQFSKERLFIGADPREVYPLQAWGTLCSQGKCGTQGLITLHSDFDSTSFPLD